MKGNESMAEPFNTERDLTPAELEERTAMRDRLDDERDAIVTLIDDHRRQIRKLNVTRKRHEMSLRSLRLEIRTGKVIESPQVALGLALPPTGDPFEVRYPMARDFQRLHAELAIALQPHGGLTPSIEKLEKCAKHPSTGIFQAIAHWARTEVAHINAKEHPDLQLPSRMPMPEKLVEVRMYLAKKTQPRPRAAKVNTGNTPKSIAVTPSKKPRGKK
jgi:hypothetical protein